MAIFVDIRSLGHDPRRAGLSDAASIRSAMICLRLEAARSNSFPTCDGATALCDSTISSHVPGCDPAANAMALEFAANGIGDFGILGRIAQEYGPGSSPARGSIHPIALCHNPLPAAFQSYSGMQAIRARGALERFLSEGMWLSECPTGKVDFLLWAEQYVNLPGAR